MDFVNTELAGNKLLFRAFTAWILLHLQAQVLPPGYTEDFFFPLCVATEKEYYRLHRLHLI